MIASWNGSLKEQKLRTMRWHGLSHEHDSENLDEMTELMKVLSSAHYWLQTGRQM
jgi:hypothetical protein